MCSKLHEMGLPAPPTYQPPWTRPKWRDVRSGSWRSCASRWLSSLCSMDPPLVWLLIDPWRHTCPNNPHFLSPFLGILTSVHPAGTQSPPSEASSTLLPPRITTFTILTSKVAIIMPATLYKLRDFFVLMRPLWSDKIGSFQNNYERMKFPEKGWQHKRKCKIAIF